MVNRIVVGAHYGIRDWLAQRVTAAVMAVYTVILAVALLSMSEVNYESWRALFAHGVMRFVTFLFFVSLFYHAWIGVRDIFMDYIKPTGVRLVLHVIAIVLLTGCFGWAAQTLWRL
jgi:succinate dehydrogenase / fumarate reductase, membrane anchor subunit